ncbi:MAG: hypothetical protein ACK52I_18890 [Pseudomonadota bacterium]
MESAYIGAAGLANTEREAAPAASAQVKSRPGSGQPAARRADARASRAARPARGTARRATRGRERSS